MSKADDIDREHVLNCVAISKGYTDWVDAYHRFIPPACDCIASGNANKPKQHGADPHAKTCAVYQ